jgi:hypothetical protein
MSFRRGLDLDGREHSVTDALVTTMDDVEYHPHLYSVNFITQHRFWSSHPADPDSDRDLEGWMMLLGYE